MTRKPIALLALTLLVSGLALALTGCFFFDPGVDDDSDDGQQKVIDGSSFPLSITYVNRSDNSDLPTIFVFARNAVPGFDDLADGVAWRTLPNIGRGSSSEFTVLPMCTVSAMWGGVNRTQSLLAEPGQRYAVQQDETGIVLAPVGSASQSNAVEVTCEISIPGGITAQLFNDGKLLMQEQTVAYGQKASFVWERKLYWGIASEIQESQMLRTAVLNSPDFFEQDLNGVSSGATVTLTGDWQSGFQFEVEND